MTRQQWIQKLDLLERLVRIGDITEQIRNDVIDKLIDQERHEWDLIETQHTEQPSNESNRH